MDKKAKKEVLKAIKKAIKKGYSSTYVKNDMVFKGWPEDIVEDLIKKARKQAHIKDKHYKAVSKDIISKIHYYQKRFDQVKNEIKKAVVGQEEIINEVIICLIANGHALLEGVPGIAKTLIIRSLAVSLGCGFKRIQFTVDLLPTDVTGITAYNEKKGFYTVKGPLFTNFIIADEINRAPPKTQSALLEAMQEKQVTIGKETFPLPKPFFVMANQNPLEVKGTYDLPEAQLDRFLFKLYIGYPSLVEEERITEINITTRRFEEFKLKPVLSAKEIIDAQEFVKKIHVSKDTVKYCVSIVDATRNPEKYKVKLGRYIGTGASPRGTIGLFISSKANALLKGRTYVTPQDIKEVAKNVLRHRVLLNYDGIADEIKTDKIIDEILAKVPIP